MKRPVIAIGLDSASAPLVEAWMAEGSLETLSQLRAQGTYTRLESFDYVSTEVWASTLTGRSREETGYWGPLRFCPNSYEEKRIKAYDYEEHKPFYALGEEFRVAIMDPPQIRIQESANGVQVLAWGSHAPRSRSMSQPESLFEEIVDSYGRHPSLVKGHLTKALNPDSLRQLHTDHRTGIARRADICRDLLDQEPWDLLLTVYGEPHVAGHFMWHVGQQNHPLYPIINKQIQTDSLKETYIDIDRSIAEILKKAPEDVHVLIFSVHGMDANTADVPSMVVLPEFLYRLSFPGKRGLDWGDSKQLPGPPVTELKNDSYEQELWSKKSESNPLRRLLRRQLSDENFRALESRFGRHSTPDLASPFYLREKRKPAPYIPASWYAPLWHQMKAFALPSFSDGLIRINLKGREAQGIVEPDDYDSFCDELSQKLHALRDSRTGKAIVKEIIRTRQSPLDTNPKLPSADLFVVWQKEDVVDTIDSPDCGRFGPVPHRRTGGHTPEGFLIAKGPDIEAGSSLPGGHILDLAPTILKLMGAPVHDQYPGTPLL